MIGCTEDYFEVAGRWNGKGDGDCGVEPQKHIVKFYKEYGILAIETMKVTFWHQM